MIVYTNEHDGRVLLTIKSSGSEDVKI